MREDFQKTIIEMIENEISTEIAKKEIQRNKRPFELILEPHHISKTGFNMFKVINCHIGYGRIKYFTMRLEMSCRQSKVVRFPYDHNLDVIKIVRDAFKTNASIYIALNDVRLLSYAFNRSSGIVMSSSGFRILHIIERDVNK